MSPNLGLIRHTARAYCVRSVHVLQEGQAPDHVHRYGQVINLRVRGLEVDTQKRADYVVDVSLLKMCVMRRQRGTQRSVVLCRIGPHDETPTSSNIPYHHDAVTGRGFPRRPGPFTTYGPPMVRFSVFT